jgi:hypothetical protein
MSRSHMIVVYTNVYWCVDSLVCELQCRYVCRCQLCVDEWKIVWWYLHTLGNDCFDLCWKYQK